MEYPKYLVRPDDYTVFTLVVPNDGKYSIRRDDDYSFTYNYDLLISLDFFPATDDDLPELKKKSDLYYEWLLWSGRSDGHGGSKGGTMEEFLFMKKNFKKT